MNQRKRLLIINDEPDMLDQMRRWLSGGGYTIHTTLSGKEGVELATKNRFDLIVLDYNLKKEKEGEKTAKEFIPQFVSVNPSIPIIVVSATDGNISASELGVSDVLIVNGSFWKNLLDVVKELLRN